MTEPPFPGPHRIVIGLFTLLAVVILLFLYDIALCLIFFVKPRWLYDINSRLAECVWLPLQYLFLNLREADITFSGDYHNIPRQENAFIVSNHQSWTDFYAVHTLAQKKSMLGRCRYFAKSSLRYIPFFGWALQLSGMILVKRNWATDRVELEKTFASMKERKWPVCTTPLPRRLTKVLTMFVEGTRLKPSALARSQEYSKKTGQPILKNVLVPRHKGFIAAITALRGSHVRHVYVAYYPTDLIPPTMLQIFCLPRISPFYKIHVHIRRFDIIDLPKDADELSQWLMDRWIEKDQMLEDLKGNWISEIQKD